MEQGSSNQNKTRQPASSDQKQRRWGIRLDGCGEQLEALIRQHVGLAPKDHAYTLVEVGSADCVSLRSFADIIKEECSATQRPWSVIGTDLPPGKAWSMDPAKVAESLSGIDHEVLRLDVTPATPGATWHNKVTLCLDHDPRVWLNENLADKSVHFAFIDGSHGRSCAIDFVALQNKIAPGGLVVFHDYGEAEQGTDWQPVDREFISVRNYVHRLGLAAPCVEARKGWRFVGEIQGSRHWGGDGNSAAVVQRTTEPLEWQPKLSAY
jgi:hypothetical protein